MDEKIVYFFFQRVNSKFLSKFRYNTNAAKKVQHGNKNRKKFFFHENFPWTICFFGRPDEIENAVRMWIGLCSAYVTLGTIVRLYTIVNMFLFQTDVTNK